MTRRMFDSVTPANLPEGADLYGGYIDGHYANIAAIQARFPGRTVLQFTTRPTDNEGDCLDIENGDAGPDDAPAWTFKRRLSGHKGPLNYCSWSTLPDVLAAYKTTAVVTPGFIVAGYPSPDGNQIPVVPGVNIVGHQWIDHGPYDESIVKDYLPGIDPLPLQPTKEQQMNAILVNGQPVVYAASPAGHLMEFTKTASAPGWSVNDITATLAQAFPADPPFTVQP